jgi:hypothetical protein
VSGNKLFQDVRPHSPAALGLPGEFRRCCDNRRIESVMDLDAVGRGTPFRLTVARQICSKG